MRDPTVERSLEKRRPEFGVPVLTVQGLSFAYPGQTTLLRDCSLELWPGEVGSLVGRSGVGKSTLARLATGLLGDQNRYDDETPSAIRYAFGEERIPPWQGIQDHLQDATGLSREAISQKASAFLLNDELLLHRGSQLSTGQRQRVNLLRHSLLECACLILDEVLGSVDAPTRRHCISKTLRSEAAQSWLFITHDLLEAVMFSDWIFLLRPLSDGAGATIERRAGLGASDFDDELHSEALEGAAYIAKRLVQP